MKLKFRIASSVHDRTLGRVMQEFSVQRQDAVSAVQKCRSKVQPCKVWRDSIPSFATRNYNDLDGFPRPKGC
jgi:hypothetical protein